MKEPDGLSSQSDLTRCNPTRHRDRVRAHGAHRNYITKSVAVLSGDTAGSGF